MLNISNIKGVLKKDYNIAGLTWFKIGGNAKYFFKPYDIYDLQQFIKDNEEAISNNLNIQIIGAGSNIVVDDKGVDGVVIKLGRPFTNIEIIDNKLHVGGGCLNYNLSRFCLENNIRGFEFLLGIPGTIGGGIAMNAGAYNSEFKDIIDSVYAIDQSGVLKCFSNKEMEFSYRSNGLKEKMIFTKAVFNFEYGNHEQILSKINHIKSERIRTQPVNSKTCGSVFKNPTKILEDGSIKQYKSWQLIDQSGLRGKRIGDVGVSDLHCNFFINHGNGTCDQVLELGRYIQDKIYQDNKIVLEWEIKHLK